MPALGGTGDVREPDEHVHQITRDIKGELESRTGLQFSEFTAVKYRSQLVNGTNYFIKDVDNPDSIPVEKNVEIQCGESDHVHVRAHKTFQGHVTLSAYQLDKQLCDELEYFQ